jgi:PAS domain-containing protein
LRFIYVNRAACELRGVTREQYLEQMPWDAIGITREQVQLEYEDLIAAAGGPQRVEFLGARLWTASAGGWIYGSKRCSSMGVG